MLLGATALATAAAAALALICASIVSPSTSSFAAAHPWAAAAAGAWLACELVFFLHLRRLHKRLDRVTPPPRIPSDPEAFLARTLDALDSGPYPIETFWTLWCGARRLADVRWGNARAFLAWAFFADHEANLTASQRAALNRMEATVRRRYGPRLQLAEGTNTALQPMAMTLQPMEWYHRPLLVYLVITVIPHALLHLFLRAIVGLRRHTLPDGHVYWHRPGQKQNQDAEGGRARLPLVFFHGVGGLGLYAALVWQLARARAGPVVLVEIPHVGLTLQSFEAKGPAEVVATVEAICARHGIEEFCVAGHSYGSIWAGWVLTGLPQRAKQAVLFGPVAFCLFLPCTTLSFLYRRPHEPELDHHHHNFHEKEEAPSMATPESESSAMVSTAAVAAAAAAAAAAAKAAAAREGGEVAILSSEAGGGNGHGNGNGNGHGNGHGNGYGNGGNPARQGKAGPGPTTVPAVVPPRPPPHRRKTLVERVRHLALDYILHYVVSRELTVANAMRRQFWWYENTLWADNIHCPLICAMGSCDQLLAVPTVAHHVRTHHPKPTQVEVIIWDGFCHAEFLLAPCLHRSFVRAIAKQERALGLAASAP